MLMRRLRCWWQIWPFLSPTSFNAQPTAQKCHQHHFNSCIPWFVLFHFEFHNDHPENGNMVLCCSLLLNKVHSYHSLLLLNRINFKFDHVGNHHVMDPFFHHKVNIYFLDTEFKLRICIMTLFWFFGHPNQRKMDFIISDRSEPTREYLFIQFFTIHILTDN